MDFEDFVDFEDFGGPADFEDFDDFEDFVDFEAFEAFEAFADFADFEAFADFVDFAPPLLAAAARMLSTRFGYGRPARRAAFFADALPAVDRGRDLRRPAFGSARSQGAVFDLVFRDVVITLHPVGWSKRFASGRPGAAADDHGGAVVLACVSPRCGL